MAQISNISEQVQLKSSAHKVYDYLANKMDRFAPMFPENLKSYKFVEGNGFTHGSVVHWKYDFGCLAEVTVRILLDKPNKSITFECLDGDLFKDFEVFRVKVQVTDGGNSGASSVEWSVQFVKSNEDVPTPHNYLQFGVKMCRGLDAYLCNNMN